MLRNTENVSRVPEKAAALVAKQKEQLFNALLKARLIRLGYTVAVPEPDMGEDLWIACRTTEADGAERTIYRAQLKSARTTGSRYETNDYVRTLRYAMSQPRFVYFYGLHDEELSASGGDPFHVGCVPASFWSMVSNAYPTAGTSGDRFFWQFSIKRPIASGDEHKFICNIRRAANVDLTDFFRDLEYGLRVARGESPMPSLRIVQDRDGGKRRFTAPAIDTSST
jgi:hypothetical protein